MVKGAGDSSSSSSSLGIVDFKPDARVPRVGVIIEGQPQLVRPLMRGSFALVIAAMPRRP